MAKQTKKHAKALAEARAASAPARDGASGADRSGDPVPAGSESTNGAAGAAPAHDGAATRGAAGDGGATPGAKGVSSPVRERPGTHGLPSSISWKEDPDGHDYPAAHDFLSLLLNDAQAEHAVAVLQRAPLIHRKAKDLLRASGLPLLALDNPAVARDLAKVVAGLPLSPVLALRGRLGTGVPLTIADGYHRICASYHLDENADIPVRLGDIARR